MMYAIGQSGERIRATPKQSGWCPDCRQPLVAKCGVINTWHWAHVQQTDCDYWSEPESLWHMMWKAHFPEEAVEVSMNDGNERHRADVFIDNTVIELQHSPISPGEIMGRERFYKNMVWVFDAIEANDTDRLNIRNKGAYYTFRWKHPRKHLAYCTKPIFLDLGNDQLLRVRKIHTESPCGGWGNIVDLYDFIYSFEGA